MKSPNQAAFPNPLLSLCLLTSALFAFAFYTQGGGFLDIESQAFLLNYTAERGLFQKVMDVARNDWNCYQAREFSYLIDFFDAKFIQASISQGIVHFFSVTHYLLIFCIGLIHWYFVSKHMKSLNFQVGLLLFLLYLSTPSSMIASFFRTSKILVASLMFLICWLSFFETKQMTRLKDRATLKKLLLLFTLGLVMSLSDRQGFFFTVSLTMIFAFLRVAGAEKRWGYLAVVFATASVTNVFYNLVLGPYLIESSNGYAPDFSFQNLSFLVAFEELSLRTIVGRFVKAALLVPENFAYFFGNLGVVWGGVALVGITLLVLRYQRASEKHVFYNYRYALAFMMALGLTYVLSIILILRAPYLAWIEHKVVYYWIPTNALILFLVTILTHLVLKEFPQYQKKITLALMALFCLNVMSLRGHYQSYTSEKSHFGKASAAAPVLRRCLVEKDVPIESFQLNPRQTKICVQFRG